MPAQDTKITALAAITTVAPANDLLPIVDVSDNSMAASGTTKNITVNQILGAGGTATLASATITGDLTVATNRLVVNASGVCIGTTTATPFAGSTKAVVGGGSGAIGLTLYGGVANITGLYFADGIVGNETYRGYLEYSHATDSFAFGTSGVNRYTIDSTGIATWLVSGSTAMTLNATGLGVGTVPANGIKLSSFVTTDGAPATSGTSQTSGSLRIGAASTTGSMDMGTAGSYSWIQALDRGNLATNYDLALQPNGGNVGIGVATFGTSAAKVLSIGTGTEPTTGPAGSVQFFTSTRSASNTIPAIFTEGSGVTNAAITNTTVTNKIAIKVNGTIYYLLATTSAA